MRKNKVFRPCKIPRYLLGSVKKDVWRTDLKAYNAHRYKVFTAKSRTDSSPFKLNPFKVVNWRRLSHDRERLIEIDRQNKLIVRAINIINRTTGRVDSYNPQAYASNSRWTAHERKMRVIDADNKAFYKKLIAVSSGYSRKKMMEDWVGIVDKMNQGSKYGMMILHKPTADDILATQPSISSGLEKLSVRPLCFLDFQIAGGVFLGRVVIELYHDHVPVTVQNFLSICSGENERNLSYKDSPVYRIVPGRFIETGDITKGTGKGGTSIYGRYFAEEGHKLKHTKAGVLSMVRVHNHLNNSRFIITFANMQSLDRQNVVFGRIIKGADNLLKMEGYGRHIGKPLAPIYISNCGKC